MSAMSLSSPQWLRLTSAQRFGPMEVDLEREPVPKRTLSPREKMLVHVMDRLAGIDVQRTFDLDGSGFVSTAVLRRSLITFDPQVFTEECIDLLFSRHLSRPCGRCGFLTYAEQLVHIHDVFGPFWQPFCRRLQHLEEKVAQTKRNAQRRQVELSQMAQDAAEALHRAQQELQQPSLLELKTRLEESEQERTRLAERLWWADKDLAQQLQAASEQSRQGLEAERRKCSSRLEQVERDKKLLQKKLADADAAKKGESTSLAAVQKELAKCRKENETLSAANAKDRQELKKLTDELEKQRQAFHKQRQQLHDSGGREEELRRELQMQTDEVAKCQQHVAEIMAERLVELKAEGEQRSRTEELRKNLEARCAQLEDELAATKQSLERREQNAEDAVHRAVVRTRAELEEQFQGKLRGFESLLDATEGRLKKAEEEKEDLTQIVGKISEELCQMQRDLDEKRQQMSDTHELSKTRVEQLREQRQQLIEQSNAQQKEFADRLEFLSGEVIRLKLENATLEQQLGQRSMETTRFSQEKIALEDQVSQAKRAEEEAKQEQEKLQSELQVQRQLCQESQSKLASMQKEAQEMSREFTRRGNQEKQLLDVSGCLYRLEEQMQEILVQWSMDGDAPAPAALASELRAKLEQKLETEKAQKEMMEAKLAETASALDSAQKQLAQKGWEAADALAAVNDEMARQRSVSDERQRLLEEETLQLRRRMEDLLAQNSKVADSSLLRQKMELEVQLQSKVQELQEQSAYVKQLEESARLAATQAAQATKASRTSEEEREKFAELRSKLWAREDELVAVRSELEAFKKDASMEESRHQEQLAKQHRIEEERDEFKGKLEKLQTMQLEVDQLGEAGDDEQLLVVREEKKQFHHQLQGVAQDLTSTLRELETKAVAEECPKQLGATKRALTHLQEQITLVCEELLSERPTDRKKKALQQKSRGSSEHATAAFQVLSVEHDELQSKHEKMQQDLHAAERELESLHAQLAEALSEKEALKDKLQAAASSSRAKQDSESDSKIKAQEAKIEELQKKLGETQDQLALSEKEALKDKLQAAASSSRAKQDSESDSKIKAQEAKIEELQEKLGETQDQLDQALSEKEALKDKLQAAASSSRAKQDSESDSKIKAQEAKIEELQKKLEETQDQLDQAQGDLEQEQLDAAEALVSAGEDLNQLEQRTDSQNRHLEAQLAEMVEFNASAEETVDLLTQELEELKASTAEQLAESENRRKELEFHLEDTEQRLARAQDDLSQRSLDAAEALTELGEELAKAQAQSQASEAELFRLRSLLEDTSETSEPLGPLLILPEDRMLSPKSVAATIHTSEGSPSP